MPRKRKKPDYNPEKSMEELMGLLSSEYGSYDDRLDERHEPSLNFLAEEYGLNVIKVRKLLITAGAYSTHISRRVAEFSQKGMTVAEIVEETGLSKSSVNSYLPYGGIAYKMPESSVDADRAKLYRKRSQAVTKLQKSVEKTAGDVDAEKELLWKCVEIFEGYRFKTVKDLPFIYELKRNRKGVASGELFFSRKNKGVTRATVELAYDRVVLAREKQGVDVPKLNSPKRLNVFGASYLYPMFIRFGIVEIG